MNYLFRSVIVFNLISIANAQTINKLNFIEKNVQINSVAKIAIEFESNGSPWCGIVVDWGDGRTQPVRIGHDGQEGAPRSPFYLENAYKSSGKFTVKVSGETLIRGLGTAKACSIDVTPTEILVLEPKADKVPSTLSNLPVCQGTDASRWNNCFGTQESINGDKYAGGFVRGQRHGQGSLTGTDGAGWVGEFENGKLTGRGTLTAGDGNKYVGNLNDGSLEGYGTLTKTNGVIYVGMFKNGEFHGKGTLSDKDGGKYVGEFKKGLYEGLGTMSDKDGGKYVGEYKGGRISGQGSMTSSDGTKYVGEFKDDQIYGQGTLTHANGNTLVAFFKDGKAEGQGTLTYTSGRKYVGQFKNSKANGLGTLYEVNGTIINQGLFVEDSFSRSDPQAQAAESKNNLTGAQEQKRDDTQIEQRKRQLDEQLLLAEQEKKVSPPIQKITRTNRRALVIGNDSYLSVGKLINARQDAKAIALNLTSVGYIVTLKFDQTEKEMKATLRTFSSQIQGGDEVLFFFAGHGVQFGATNYLLPTDIGGESEAQVKDEAIELQRILDDINERKTRFSLIIIDACRDNPFKTVGRNIGGRGLAPTTAATGQMVVFSAGSGQQALDRLGDNDKNINGVFTRTFLKEMQKTGVSIDRIVKNVRNEVAELAKSIGHQQVPAIYDQVLGDFYFKD